MDESIDVVIIGGGQAGLATSLEQGRLGQTWRTRWDSFCLVTPNWSVRLPGHPYDGDDPDGYMPRDEIVAYLERYAAGFGAPVREGVKVTSLAEAPAGGFLLLTSDGEIRAKSVVVATGAYQRANRPEAARSLPAGLPQIDAEEYRSPAELPPGSVLVVGSGQSGCQIAEELREAGREVFLACGRAPWSPRRIGGRDLMWWVLETGFFDQKVEELPAPAARLVSNVLATGRNGGHDLHLRTLRDAGVTLLGHFLGADAQRARFADDLGESVAWGDDRYRELIGRVNRLVEERGLPAPGLGEPASFDGAAPQELDLAGVGIVIFAGGFRPNYGRWVDVPGAFDELGFPRHTDGASSAAAGLYFVGVHFLRTRKSSLLCGVGEDAALVARQLAAARPLPA
jgi:putative flavoprotein involved in K+ transport